MIYLHSASFGRCSCSRNIGYEGFYNRCQRKHAALAVVLNCGGPDDWQCYGWHGNDSRNK